MLRLVESEGTTEKLQDRRYLTTQQACDYLNVHRSTLYRDVQLARCASRVGRGRGKLVWDRNALDRLMAVRSDASLDRAA